MISKIVALGNVGRFINFQQSQDFEIRTKVKPNNCNIIFGFNGSGKSTISNVLSLFGTPSFTKNKDRVLQSITRDSSSNVDIKILLQNSKKLIWNSPALSQLPSLYVFNTNFVFDHVLNGVRKFMGTSEALTTPELKNINTKIEELKTVKLAAKAEKERLDEEFKKIRDRLSKDFNEKISAARLTYNVLASSELPSQTMEELEKQRELLLSEYEQSIKSTEIAEHVEQLQKMNLHIIDLDVVDIKLLLKKKISQLSKSALEQRIKDVQSKLVEGQSGIVVEDWFRYGKKILELPDTLHCPLCNSDLTGRLNLVLQDFDEYFGKEYDWYINRISEFIKQIDLIISEIGILSVNIDAIRALHSSYKKLLPDLHFVKPDIQRIKDVLSSIRQCLEQKLNNISTLPNISQEDIDFVAQFNFDLSVIVKFKADLLNKLQNIAPRKLEVIVNEIKNVYRGIAINEFNNLNSTNSTLEDYLNKNRMLEVIDTMDPNDERGLLFWNNKKITELSKIKAESAGINMFLKIMGIDTFTVDLRDKQGDETKDIVIKYNISASEKSEYCLSDGEKTALGFAYFLSKFESEVTEEQRANAIVVIDDPISSLDENRLYSTSHLITDVFKGVKQLIVLSHNFLFLKFFNAIYGGSPKHFFINKDVLGSLPEELKNFETTYFYMLRDIQKFNAGLTEYNSARKYLPNFIRRVLETFLSFKFSILNSASNLNRSPDLHEFIAIMGNNGYNDDLIQKLKKIIDITNKQSHGSVQSFTGNYSYISEEELKQISTWAIEIMVALDSMHMTCVENFDLVEQNSGITQEEQEQIESGRAVKVSEPTVTCVIANTEFVP